MFGGWSPEESRGRGKVMRIEAPKGRVYSRGLEGKAIEFHGHGGPFMVIGLRMGLAALGRLDAHGWFDLSCKVYLEWAPPDSCVIDGVQSSTGCTMGKRNIAVVERPGIEAEFTSQGRWVRLRVRDEVLDKVKGTLGCGEAEVRGLMDELVAADEVDLFEVFSGLG